jgi:hypothetical protein
MFLHEEDVETLRLAEVWEDTEEYVIIDNSDKPEPEIVHREKKIAHRGTVGMDFSALYREAQDHIVKKDEIIQDLAYRLGKTETELANSIPLVEYKKATFLLESAKTKTDTDASMLGQKVNTLEKEVSKRNSYIFGLATLLVIVIAFSLFVFFYFRFLVVS